MCAADPIILFRATSEAERRRQKSRDLDPNRGGNSGTLRMSKLDGVLGDPLSQPLHFHMRKFPCVTIHQHLLINAHVFIPWVNPLAGYPLPLK